MHWYIFLDTRTFCERFWCESSGPPGSWLACHSEDNNVLDEGGSAREFWFYFCQNYSFHNSCKSILFCPESLWIWSYSGSGAPPALEQEQELFVDGFCKIVVRVNVHSQSCAGLLCGSTVMTLVDKPWKVDFCVPPDPCLVLITEPTLQGTVGKNRPRSYR